MNNLVEFVLNESQIEFYISDADSLEFIVVNQTAVSNTGYTREELLGQTAVLVMPQQTLESMKARMMPLKKGPIGKSVRVSNIHTRKDGSTYPVDVHLQFAHYQGRDVFFTLIADATENQTKLDQLHKVIRGARLGYWDFNEETGRFYVDDNWLAMLGLERGDVDESDRTDWFRLIHPEDRETLLDNVAEAVRNNGNFLLEFRMLHKDGHEVWVESAAAVVTWDYKQNRALRISGTHLDISERKRNEQEKAQYHQLFNLADDIMAIVDHGGNILKFNPATIKVLGYTEQELYAAPFINLLHEDDVDLTRVEMEKIIQDGFTRNFENRFICKDGSFRWLSWNARHDFDSGLIFATGRDITEQKEIGEKLRRQQETFRALVENSEDLIMLYGQDHSYLYMNPASEMFLGVEQGALEGKNRQYINYPDDLKTLWYETVEQVLTSGEAQKRFFDMATVDGTTAHIDWHAFPGLRDDHGQVKNVFSVARDVTQWHNVEEELYKMQRLNSIGVLAGGIAHDFNNILTILFGNLAMAKTQIGNPRECLNSLEKAESAFHRASNLTGQLLTFSKGGDPVKQDISLNSLAQDTVNFDLSGSNVKLNLVWDDDLWMIAADKGQITQVFSNLTINADQAMPDGGTLSISLRNTELGEDEIPGLLPGRYIMASVQDEGGGISKDDLDRIFDPFYSTKQTGSGLGLATVYSIIHKHGGLIKATSVVGRGSTFYLYLPALEKTATNILQVQPEPAPPEDAGHRILIMDDEEMICELAAKFLSMEGYRVDTAGNGNQAIEMYHQSMEEQAPYDCLVMDLTVPGGLGGKEAVRKILDLNPEARVVVSSGYGEDPVMANFAKYGFKGVISKPFTRQTLISEISRLIN